MAMEKFETVDEYIESFPHDIKSRLQEMRAIIKKAAPTTSETIRYGIPTFQLNGKNLVHFGGYKSHIGFYPTPNGMRKFEKELKPFITRKGTAQFPLDKPIPKDLVSKVVKFREEQLKSYKK